MILLLPAVTPVSLLSGSMHRGGFVSVLGLRIFVQDVAASFSYARLRQPYLRPRRCGDFGLVSRHKPAEHRFLMFPLFPTLRRRVSHAEERLRYQRFFTCRGAAAKSTPLTRRGAAARSTPLTRRRAAARSTPLCPSDVASMSWPDRGHHVPALTVQAVGGVSGLTWHAAMFFNSLAVSVAIRGVSHLHGPEVSLRCGGVHVKL